MANYVNTDAAAAGKHGLAESSNLKSTIVGNIYDALVLDGEGNAIAVDNGAPIVIGDYTHEGLQERNAAIAGVSDKIAFVCAPALVKGAMTKAQANPENFYIPAGKLAKAYEVVEDDIFGIADYQFTSGTPAVDGYVTVDGEGAYATVASAPDASKYGFIGKIHSIALASNETIVRIRCIQNEQLSELSV